MKSSELKKKKLGKEFWRSTFYLLFMGIFISVCTKTRNIQYWWTIILLFHLHLVTFLTVLEPSQALLLQQFGEGLHSWDCRVSGGFVNCGGSWEGSWTSRKGKNFFFLNSLNTGKGFTKQYVYIKIKSPILFLSHRMIWRLLKHFLT